MKLYHATRENVIGAIWSEGVDPHASTGQLKVSWWVDYETVIWAIAHVSARWAIPVDKVVIVEADILPSALSKWARPGIYMCRMRVPVGAVWGYEKFIQPEV